MGIKDLWTILTPHAERKPISELRGKTVAIDLAGWVCESLNVVDYFVHPRHHLKNLFFRTCYLIWEEVTPVFVLEGVAPKLKAQVIAKRNEIQFRGVKPREKPTEALSQKSAENTKSKTNDKGRTRFNHVLKQCETLLRAMGIQCLQGPGEAEAYCAFLNKKGLADGVISQDSDCFAYGAKRVYRNFSVSTQGALAAQGGAVDIYDMSEICMRMDFGQNKIIAMALLCGCDYCPDGIGGVGRDSVLKLFNKYTNDVVLERLREWRKEDAKYTALEMRVEDKTVCSNCGHLGRTQSHAKSGCGVCRTNRGCNESLWKEERLSLKSELALRKKALADPSFPCDEIINEFLKEPQTLPVIDLGWRQPNIVTFIKKIGHLLQWTEIYCFQKFFPILTRWQVRNAKHFKANIAVLAYVVPQEIIKKRTVKGVPSLELIWHDEKGFFNGLIPDEQLENYDKENPKGLRELWTTIEPLNMMESGYPDMVDAFYKSKENLKKNKKSNKPSKKKGLVNNVDVPLGSLENLSNLLVATNEIAKTIKPKRTRKPQAAKKGLQMIDKYFKQNVEKALAVSTGSPDKLRNCLHNVQQQCSTPITKYILSDLESDYDDNEYNLSAIVDDITKKPMSCELKSHVGRMLYYEPVNKNLSFLLDEQNVDDLDLMAQKRKLINLTAEIEEPTKRYSLDDSFDILVKKNDYRYQQLQHKTKHLPQSPLAAMQLYKSYFNDPNCSSKCSNGTTAAQDIDVVQQQHVSYFFDHSTVQTHDNEDVFEQLMEMNCSRKSANADECIILSDDGE